MRIVSALVCLLTASVLVSCSSAASGRGHVTAGESRTPPAGAARPEEPAVSAEGSREPLPHGTPLPSGPNVRPGERPPVLPPAARNRTQPGARAFAEYFVQTYDWSIATNDYGALISTITADCWVCLALIDEIESFEPGEHIEGGRTAATAIGVYPAPRDPEVEPDYLVRLRAHKEASTVVGGDPADSDPEPAHDGVISVLVKWIDGEWRAVGVDST